MTRMRARIAVVLMAAASIVVPAVVMALPASANACCYVQEEDPSISPPGYYMSDTYPGQPVNLTSIKETYYVETLPANFGGHTYFDYTDSKNYCLTALAPQPHQPPGVGSAGCNSNDSAQRWRWVAVGSWHYLTNLHFGTNAEDSNNYTGCGLFPCPDVVLSTYQFQWGVFSG